MLTGVADLQKRHLEIKAEIEAHGKIHSRRSSPARTDDDSGNGHFARGAEVRTWIKILYCYRFDVYFGLFYLND